MDGVEGDPRPRPAPRVENNRRPGIPRRPSRHPPSPRALYAAAPPLDPLLTPAILEQLRANLLNIDGVRSYPTRWVAVDVLKKMQRFEAYAILREARDALTAARPGLSGNELLAADDLAARIDRALLPYFN